MADDLPFRAEYAKTGRASCKKCKENIPQGTLRLAVIFQAAKFDGKMVSWYHFDCFFERQRPKSAGDIEHFDQLRWEDQEKINQMLKSGIAEPSKKGKGKGKTAKVVEPFSDFLIEYAKSGRAACRGCLEKIGKDELRISKKGYDTKGGMRHGQMLDMWYHVKCFKERREELEFVSGVDTIPGFKDLTADDKKVLSKELPALSANKRKVDGDAVDGPSDAKKIKKEEKENEQLKEEIKKQNKIQFKYRDQLETLTKQELQILLEYNDQQIPSGTSEMLDLLADVMAFGALLPCSECKSGQFFYKSGMGYQCSGNMSGWTKCPNSTTTPERKPFKVPSDLSENYSFLKKYKYVPGQRVIPALTRTIRMNPTEEVNVKKEKSDSKRPPTLEGLKFIVDSKLEKSKEKVEAEIKKLLGSVGSRVTEKIAAVISTKDNLKEKDSKLKKASELGIHVVDLSFFDAIKASTGESASSIITKKNIAPWDCHSIEKRLGLDESGATKSSGKSKSSEKSGSGMSDKLKLKLKGGGVVDPDSGLEDKAHVLKTKNGLYSVVLGIVDIQGGRNSYYKLQILEHDKGNKWHVFRAWGRVGTTIGDTKLTKMDTKQEAIEDFVALYEEKTGNLWENRDNFEKQPGKLYPLDIDYGESETDSRMTIANSTSKLHRSIQELVCMLFDVEAMKRTMVEFELDLTKMPLGKLSKKQLEKAYGILSQAQEMLDSKDVSKTKFLDISNQFYTLIPHDFGRKTPPVLSDNEIIKSKLEMLESLMEIEVAFSLLKAGDAVKDKDPIDAHYEKLNTEIEVLDKSSEEFSVIQTYAKNTHAATHTQYTLEVEEVFKVVRKGESKRFRPFSKLPNRKLLWHGSRVSNMAGILSQGLRIAPPEAPVTGYMFGKGIYFADMVSKSANYCVTSKSNPVGMLLLCDVALGKSYERKEADYIEKLKKDYQSVLGVGKTEPNPDEFKMLGDVKVPLGKPAPTKVKGSSLLYNEYIVYDVAQVNIKYLIKTKFLYK
ncbi:hypothetical protein DAPPUDRAFT_55885 [Daphnia pulex]|uniref:Poly [ADP-ribose] polymerase n=1 Tax=Daphnia pulex TaxID=6669 RepID=E9GXY1_DAPPU|nr:hypothetical protein DAPPUDRAFT_55885 [Daphnia pulex]|eukprot:EFX75651.1 hypothetical protein DAPPUDRAFT_55885 [Daphnia pulex]